MAWENRGPIDFRGSRDAEGHREFEIDYLLVTDSNQEGPASAMNSTTLPEVGSLYVFGSLSQETDADAWCQPTRNVQPAGSRRQGDFPYQVVVTVFYSTKPRVLDKERPYNSGPNGADVGDPLNEPPKVSGNGVNFTEQGLRDRFGAQIRNSAHEKILGPGNEWETGRDQIVVEMNSAALNFALIFSLKHRLNSTTMWGLPKRSIKFSNFTWRKNYGKQNSFYYTGIYTFDINLRLDDVKRGVIATTTSGSSTITYQGLSTSFEATDVGRTIYGYGIPSGTTITSVNVAAGTAVMSANATSSFSAGFFQLSPNPNLYISNWDRDLVDEGTKALRGHWNTDGTLPRFWVVEGNPDPADPQDFVSTQDTNGNFGTVILNGAGIPYSPLRDDAPGVNHVEYYREANLFLLGVPLTF